LKLNPTLDLDPKAEAKRITDVHLLVEKGKKLASEGKYNEAVTKFQEALSLDPTLDLEPDLDAKRITVLVLLKKAHKLAYEGKYNEAVAQIPSKP
jgi:tetratricopeptide (TPR) repeat protein